MSEYRSLTELLLSGLYPPFFFNTAHFKVEFYKAHVNHNAELISAQTKKQKKTKTWQSSQGSLWMFDVLIFCRQLRRKWQNINAENMTPVRKSKKRWLSGHVIGCFTHKPYLWILTKRCIEGIRVDTIQIEASRNAFKGAFSRMRICYIPDILSHPQCKLKGKYFKCVPRS